MLKNFLMHLVTLLKNIKNVSFTLLIYHLFILKYPKVYQYINTLT